MIKKHRIESILIAAVFLTLIALMQEIINTDVNGRKIEISFERLADLVIESYSVESVEAEEEYDFLLSMGDHTIRLLENIIHNIRNAEKTEAQRKKYAA